MSRIGNAPIKIPAGVELKPGAGVVKVKGPLGEIETPLPDGITMSQDGGMLKFSRRDDSREQKERHGLTRALMNNNIEGVSKGWKKNLELVGVGYRVQLKGTELVFALGYSHEVKYKLPAGIKATVNDQTKIELAGIDRQMLGQAAADIRTFRPPEPYKGKGIRYAGEAIRRKAGKAGKAGKGGKK